MFNSNVKGYQKMLECRICGYTHEFMISNSHLKKHGITGKEYKEKFPDAKLRIQTESSKNKIAEKNKGKIPYNKGKEISEEQKEKQSSSMKAKFDSGVITHWNQGKTHSEETKRKISKTLTGRELSDEHIVSLKIANERYRLSEEFKPAMLGKSHSKESKLKMSNARQGVNNHMYVSCIERVKQIAKADNFNVLSINGQFVECECAKCSNEFRFSKQMFNKSSDRQSGYCPICFPRTSGTSKKEQEFANFIESLGISIKRNDRQILGGKEIDVFIPSLNIGFEFTGLYWHAEKQNPNKNHLLWKKQMAHNAGIRLITVFEDEWDNKKELVKSRIKNILGKSETRLFARKCELVKIDSPKEYLEFLDANHMQGKMTASVVLGLKYKNELVSLMTFRKSSFVKGGNGVQWEISRFASKLNCNVVGAAGKLLKHFRNEFPNEEIISYADSRWSDGDVYKNLGFIFENSSPPSYWYTTDYKLREHRSNFMKHKIIEKFKGFPELSEWENMKLLGYDRIWDCGTTKWVLK
jgi:hypothetical protein